MIVHGYVKRSYTKKKKVKKHEQPGTNKVQTLKPKPIFAPRGDHTWI